MTPSFVPAWPDSVYNGRRAYLIALKDNAIPAIAQQMMVKHSGVEWDVKEMDTGHSPFMSHPQEVAEWIVQFSKKWWGQGTHDAA